MNDADIESHITYADDVLAHKSRSYITAAEILARAFKTLVIEVKRLRVDNKLLHDNLTATQTRCTSLLLEVRRLKGDSDG